MQQRIKCRFRKCVLFTGSAQLHLKKKKKKRPWHANVPSDQSESFQVSSIVFGNVCGENTNQLFSNTLKSTNKIFGNILHTLVSSHKKKKNCPQSFQVFSKILPYNEQNTKLEHIFFQVLGPKSI